MARWDSRDSQVGNRMIKHWLVWCAGFSIVTALVGCSAVLSEESWQVNRQEKFILDVLASRSIDPWSCRLNSYALVSTGEEREGTWFDGSSQQLAPGLMPGMLRSHYDAQATEAIRRKAATRPNDVHLIFITEYVMVHSDVGKAYLEIYDSAGMEAHLLVERFVSGKLCSREIYPVLAIAVPY